jgi:hypothetical protein
MVSAPTSLVCAPGQSGVGGSLYLKALANGLEEELEQYHTAVVALEGEVLAGPSYAALCCFTLLLRLAQCRTWHAHCVQYSAGCGIQSHI